MAGIFMKWMSNQREWNTHTHTHSKITLLYHLVGSWSHLKSGTSQRIFGNCHNSERISTATDWLKNHQEKGQKYSQVLDSVSSLWPAFLTLGSCLCLTRPTSVFPYHLEPEKAHWDKRYYRFCQQQLPPHIAFLVVLFRKWNSSLLTSQLGLSFSTIYSLPRIPYKRKGQFENTEPMWHNSFFYFFQIYYKMQYIPFFNVIIYFSICLLGLDCLLHIILLKHHLRVHIGGETPLKWILLF